MARRAPAWAEGAPGGGGTVVPVAVAALVVALVGRAAAPEGLYDTAADQELTRALLASDAWTRGAPLASLGGVRVPGGLAVLLDRLALAVGAGAAGVTAVQGLAEATAAVALAVVAHRRWGGDAGGVTLVVALAGAALRGIVAGHGSPGWLPLLGAAAACSLLCAAVDRDRGAAGLLVVAGAAGAQLTPWVPVLVGVGLLGARRGLPAPPRAALALAGALYAPFLAVDALAGLPAVGELVGTLTRPSAWRPPQLDARLLGLVAPAVALGAGASPAHRGRVVVVGVALGLVALGEAGRWRDAASDRPLDRWDDAVRLADAVGTRLGVSVGEVAASTLVVTRDPEGRDEVRSRGVGLLLALRDQPFEGSTPPPCSAVVLGAPEASVTAEAASGWLGPFAPPVELLDVVPLGGGATLVRYLPAGWRCPSSLVGAGTDGGSAGLEALLGSGRTGAHELAPPGPTVRRVGVVLPGSGACGVALGVEVEASAGRLLARLDGRWPDGCDLVVVDPRLHLRGPHGARAELPLAQGAVGPRDQRPPLRAALDEAPGGVWSVQLELGLGVRGGGRAALAPVTVPLLEDLELR